MKKKKYPELWDDKDVDEMEYIVWKGCLGRDCDACEHRLEVDYSTCHVDLISELWRKWKNALEADKENKE